jgi:hypothetical protein
MSKDPLDEFSADPLTGIENKKARKIIRDQERMDWLWASFRIWVGWLAATTAAIYAAKDYLVKIVKAIMQ